MPRRPIRKPSVFIGSSSEGLDFARAVRALLTLDAEVTMWNEGFFNLGSTFIETLVNSRSRFDFAILVLTPDDLIHSRATETFGPRDNVIFELGLFIGYLGRERAFVLHQAPAELKLPTDLAGVVTATYAWPREDKSHKAAVGAACDGIREVIRDLGVAPVRASKQLEQVQQRQDILDKKVEEMDAVRIALEGIVTKYEREHLKKLLPQNDDMVRFGPHFFSEIERLDAIGFITPLKDAGMVALKNEHGNPGEEFHLREYVTLNKKGLSYLEVVRDIN